MILDQVSQYIADNCLLQSNDRILIGVSGGIDSCVLLDILSQKYKNLGIAHCNFRLRGEESDGDEAFVRLLAGKYNIESHITHFDTAAISKERKISMEMAARDLRYDWFLHLIKKYDYTKIAIAHNRNDVIETFFINISRGTGMKGITGIKAQNGYVIRPLLFASRQMIETYAANNNLLYRHDSSNDSEEIIRNKIRHSIIPVFEEINPDFTATMWKNIGRFNESYELLDKEIAKQKNILLRKNDTAYHISISELKKLHPLKLFLYETIKEFGFNETQIDNIIESLDSQSGKIFHSAEYSLLKDRNVLIIAQIKASMQAIASITADTEELINPIHLKFTIKAPHDASDTLSDIINIDFDSLSFPLTIRKWQHGDFIRPLGMHGKKKKVSDLLTDLKLSLFDKENTWVLIAKGEIVWVIGHRISDSVRIKESTQKILTIEYIRH